MSASQVTEEHIYTTAKVGKAYVAGEDAQAAQLIADSEAKAVVEIAMVAAESADRNVSLRLERDQLRQQVANLTHSNDSHRETAETWRAAAIERDQLRAVFPKILAALGNGACCAPDVSVEFIESIPNEVAGVVAQLRGALVLGQQNCDDAYDDLRAERKEAIARAVARAESAEREAFDWKKIARYETARAERAEAEVKRLGHLEAVLRSSAADMTAGNITAGGVADLRAEVERLKSDGAASVFVNMSCRASRAETERNNLRADLDAIKAILTEEKGRAELAEAELATERARLKEMAAELAHCAGYIASVRTDRLITWHEELYALQTVEWAEGAFEIAEKANAVLEAHDAAMKEGA